MRYLGGKSRIAKEIAAVVNAARNGRAFWEPFCGGLSVSVQLAAGGPGIVSDANRALISLYRAIRDGWDPPQVVTRGQRDEALALPDENPFKAFARFGCGFGGNWSSGFARSVAGSDDDQPYARQARKAVLRDVPALDGCAIECLDFLDVAPQRRDDLVIYCDPPYTGTTGYSGVGAFDHTRFWTRCAGWVRVGVPVFVSEYVCPIPHEVVWEKAHPLRMGQPDASVKRLERLFRIL